MSEVKPYWTQAETIANEGKNESEIFNLIVEKNQKNGFLNFTKPKEKSNLIHTIRAIVGKSWFYTVDGPDEEELAEEKLQRKIQRALNPHG